MVIPGVIETLRSTSDGTWQQPDWFFGRAKYGIKGCKDVRDDKGT